jgi:hypothetical protein
VGAASSAMGQLLRAGLYGQEINWGDFFKNVGIGAVSSVASGLVSSGIGGTLNQVAKGIFGTDLSPAMNTVLTMSIAGITGTGSNLAMQLLTMAVMDGGVDWDKVD